jgi:cell division septation protein DedD
VSTSSPEPSYYEIALTNRQVVVAFVILLLCLVTAFFSGVWVGRSAAEPGEQVVRNTPPPPAEPTEGTNLQELEFFDQPGERSGRAAEPAPGPTTLQEDLERRAGAEPPAGDAPELAPEPVPPPPAPPVRTTPPPAPPEERAEVVRPRPLPETTGRTAGREPAAGSVVIQVFASPDEAEATRIRQRLAKAGQKAYLSPVTVDGRTMYRVRIGPFASREEAQGVAETVRKTYKLDTWVTQ